MAVFAARITGAILRLLGRGATNLPGKIAHILYPPMAQRLAQGLPKGVILVSGTNGKTTTANLFAEICRKSGICVVSNSEGANLMSGITTALINMPSVRKKNSGLRKKNNANSPDGNCIGIFEVDEAVLGSAISTLAPHTLILGNLFRDQLDRYGELEILMENWQKALLSHEAPLQILANADDPLIVSVLSGIDDKAASSKASVLFYGVEDPSVGRASQPPVKDAYNCRKCGEELDYEIFTVAHLGKWSCKECGNQRPHLDFAADNIKLDGIKKISLDLLSSNSGTAAINSAAIKLPLAGLHNIYNAMAAAAAARCLGISYADIKAAIDKAPRVFGRFEEISVNTVGEISVNNDFTDKKNILLLLAKNPTSVNENLHALFLGTDEAMDLLVILNDKAADGKDISWIWDVDYEMAISAVRHATVSGTRAADMGLRLLYGGLPESKIHIQPSLKKALEQSLKKAPQRLVVLLTYTGLLEFRKILQKQKLVQPFWKKNASELGQGLGHEATARQSDKN